MCVLGSEAFGEGKYELNEQDGLKLVLPWNERLLNIDAFDPQLFAFDHPHIRAMALRTIEGFLGREEGIPALHAAHFGGHTLKIEPGALGDGAFGQHIPVKLDRFVNGCCQLTNNQVDGDYAPGASLFSMAQGNFEDRLGDGKLMHSDIARKVIR